MPVKYENTAAINIPKPRPVNVVFNIIRLMSPNIVGSITRNRVILIIRAYKLEPIIDNQIKVSFLYFFKNTINGAPMIRHAA